MLKIGTVGPTFPPIERIPRQAKRLEELGYDSIWFPDHLMGWYPQSIWTPDIAGDFANSSPHAFFETTLSIALAASTTSTLLMGSSVTEPIRHPPAMLAQSFATLEHITKGRCILGIGAGERENIEPYGLKYDHIVSRLEEALQVIRLCWNSQRDELLNFEGKYYNLKDAVFELPPLTGRPPIWIGGARPKMAQLVGTYADGWLPFNITVDDYRNRVQIIKEAAKKAGRKYDNITKALYTGLIIDPNQDECLRILQAPLLKAHALAAPAEIFEKCGYEHPLGDKYYGLTDFVPSRFTKKEVLEAIEKVPLDVLQESYLWGTPEDIIEKMEQFIKLGMSHWVIWNETYFGDPTKVRSSYTSVGEVMNYLKEST
ncbi:MAG: LLM class flavin-dependent oxidoreductase [Candidatus Freyarchaeum deiterrae]